MTISANTLFHFTRNKKTLLSILKTKFYPRLCLEQSMIVNNEKRKWAVPMVCFCDIPLSNISDHSAKYGYYAIGVKKRWAIERGITPILYVHKNSVFVEQAMIMLKKSLFKIEEGTNKKKIDTNHIISALPTFFMMKPYEGLKSKKIVRFYDEREWRFLPRLNLTPVNFLMDEKYFKDEKLRTSIDSNNEQFGLSFTPDDINYIIVKSENEILQIKKDITSLTDNYSHKSVELLSTRIISMERIKEDF